MNQIWVQPTSAQAAAPTARTLSIVARGGSCCFFEVEAGDRLRIVDPEGRQPAYLYVQSGAFVGVGSAGAGEGYIPRLTDVLGKGDTDCQVVDAALLARGIAQADLEAHALFHANSEAGISFAATSASQTACVLVVPGGPMAPDAQNPPTDLRVEIEPSTS